MEASYTQTFARHFAASTVAQWDIYPSCPFDDIEKIDVLGSFIALANDTSFSGDFFLPERNLVLTDFISDIGSSCLCTTELVDGKAWRGPIRVQVRKCADSSSSMGVFTTTTDVPYTAILRIRFYQKKH